MKRKFLLIAVMTVLLFGTFFSCKKDTETPHINVTFTSPSESEIFPVPDTITVKFSVESELPIQNIRASIDNNSLIPLSPAVYITPDETQHNFDIPLVVDILPDSDNSKAYVHLVISDGAQSDHWYLAIGLSIKPLVYKGFSVTISANEQGSTLFFYNENGVETDHVNISGKAEKTMTIPESDLLVMATSTPEHLMAISFEDHQVIWTKNAPFPNPAFTCLYSQAPYLYYGVGAGRVVGAYAGTGLQQMETPIFEDYQPTAIGSGRNNLIYAETSSTGQSSRITTCYLNTGELQEHYLTDFQAVFANSSTDTTIVFIGNQEPNGKLLVFDSKHIQAVSGQLFYFGEITYAAVIDQNNYMMASKQGVYHYNLATDLLKQVFTAQVEIGHLSCDTTTQLIYIGDGNELQVLDFPHFTNTNTLTFENQVIGVNMRYVR